MIEAVDRVVNDPKWLPYWGWHDDHRERDRQPGYLPAIQQVRAEFAELLAVCRHSGMAGNRALQLGMGAQRASHEALLAIFQHVMTIDDKVCSYDTGSFHGLDCHLASAIAISGQHAPYDLLLIDAGHKFDDIEQDFANYAPLIRKGGVIAVHDAVKRAGYENEIDVWRWLEQRPTAWNMIGTEVGIAWTIQT